MVVLEVCNARFPFQGIEEEATNCLLNNPYHRVRTVSCTYSQGVLFLRGHLPNFFQKQVAQEAVARVQGVTQVVNEIEVD